MPRPPPLVGAPITLYQWFTSPIGDACSACMQLMMTPSFTPRPRPHALCVCLGDLPVLSDCTFDGRQILHSETEIHEVPGPVVPGHGSVEWTTSAHNTVSASISHEGGGTGASISGSRTSGQETTWSFDNNDDSAQRLYEVWENVLERWIDTVTCTVLGFSVAKEIPGEESRQDFLQFISRPFEP